MTFIHKWKQHFYTNTLFQRSQPHLPWVFNSCILKTSTARSLQRSPSCSFFRIQLCARAVGRLCSKRKYLSVAFKSSRSQKFLLSCSPKFSDSILLLIKIEFNSIFHIGLYGAMGQSHKKPPQKTKKPHYKEKYNSKK